MACAYICIAPHGVYTSDGLYLKRGDIVPSLDNIPPGRHHRFGVIEVPDSACKSEAIPDIVSEKAPDGIKEEVEVSED